MLASGAATWLKGCSLLASMVGNMPRQGLRVNPDRGNYDALVTYPNSGCRPLSVSLLSAPVNEEDKQPLAVRIRRRVARARRLLPKMLVDERELAGLTEEQLAEATGQLATQTAINNWSQSPPRREPGVFRLLAVAEALGVSVDYLLGRTGKAVITDDLPVGYALNQQLARAILRETKAAKLAGMLHENLFSAVVAVSAELPKGLRLVPKSEVLETLDRLIEHFEKYAPRAAATLDELQTKLEQLRLKGS